MEEIITALRSGEIKTREDLNKWKKKVKTLVRNSQIISTLNDDDRDKYAPLLLKKPTRSLSGVTVITVMTRQGRCPHGVCTYCPIVPGVPFSYTGDEPASMRGKKRGWDPYLQVFDRLKQYYAVGHKPSKIEMVVNGGTFLNHPKEYKEWFIRRLYQALNNYPIAEEDKTSLVEAKKMNETTKHRMVALVLETKPDCFDVEEVLRYGCTRIEFGVQNLDDKILESVNRGHGLRESIEATTKAKQAGLKVDYHMMLGLPGATIESDVSMFEELFKNPALKPDGLKIYPTLLMKQAALYKKFLSGEYKPIDDNYVFEVLKQVKPKIPRYVRIKRIMRDIPLTKTDGNLRKGNIRELVCRAIICNCIRCREVGRKKTSGINPEINVYEYHASGAKEFFISADDSKSDSIIGFLRLRIDRQAVVRELHVYGTQIPVGEEGVDFQHKGFGKALMKKAEEITLDHGLKKLSVLSGIGVKEYYKKIGYAEESYYVAKIL